MKKVCAFVCVMMVVLSMISTSAFAAAPEEKTIDLGDGFYMIETITQSSAEWSRSSNKAGSKTGKVYYDSTLIGVATLSAVFDISGTTANATAATMNGYGQNGGSYSDGSTKCSGSKAVGTAYFKFKGVTRSVEITLSCSPDGTLS